MGEEKEEIIYTGWGRLLEVEEEAVGIMGGRIHVKMTRVVWEIALNCEIEG